MTTIQIPNGWRPRPYQMDGWAALESGIKRGLLVWHRRSGKDDLALHWTARSTQVEPGTYWHMLPKMEQARKAIWDATVDRVMPDGRRQNIRRVDWAFPEELRERTRDDLMQIRFKSGAVWQVVGSDNYNNLVGSNPKGVVFSEWALADPAAWAFIRPILAENGGWALFVTTPRGRNHCAADFEGFKEDPGWFVQRLTANDTGVFTNEQLQQERRELMAQHGVAVGQALYRQEYECSFEAPVLGAYYAEWLDELENKGGITTVPYDPEGGPVVVSFDLGIGDQTALWFAQAVGREVRILDYYASMGVGLDHYVDAILSRFKRHQLGELILPHDGAHRRLQTGKSDREYLDTQGFDTALAPSGAGELMEQINAVRRFLPKCVFDREKCATGLSALRNYRAEYDDQKRVIHGKPVHDWASHGADSFRTLVMGWDLASSARAVSRSTGLVRRQMGCPV